VIERKAVAVSQSKHDSFGEDQQRCNGLFDEKMAEVHRMKEDLKQLEEEIERTER